MNRLAFIRGRLNPAMARAMTEDELLLAITEAASYLGWRWHHVRRSDLAIQQGHQGFPDLVLARGGVVLFLELKDMEGHLSPDQVQWLEELRSEADLELPDEELRVRVVRPTDLDGILERLGAKLPPAAGDMAAST